MAPKQSQNTSKEETPRLTGILPTNISQEMRDSYLDYAMSVITSRALPDVRDGLKPVHRRILYAMHELGLTHQAKFKKSATVVGDVLGKYHPHGDSAVYEAMVKMAQDFSHRYPLILGQGNFGSIDGDAAAAMRYTEAKMSKVSFEILRDLEKETVEWRPNYDGSHKEPSVLPSALPNLLLNGTFGIAVGMASRIPPHNLGEVTQAVEHLIDHQDATTEDLMQFVKGPDFPTGGVAYGLKDLEHAYATGRGGVVTRGVAEIIEGKNDQYQIIITSIPYQVNKVNLITSIADLVRDKKIEGVKELRDESTKDIRIVIGLKGGISPERVLNTIYKHTELETVYHFNMVALVDGVPQTLSLKGILEQFVLHRKTVVVRRTQFDLKNAEARAHILAGLKKALDHIDAIIKLIRASKDVAEAHASLMKTFKFSDLQATAILEMRLQKLASLERQKIELELKEVEETIADLKSILGSEKKIFDLIKGELSSARERYADERATKIVKGGVKEMRDEDLIEDKEAVLVFTSGGYIKRTDPAEYKQQRRGGVGVIDLNTKEEDFVTMLVSGTAHNDLLFFTDKGKVYQMKMYDIPEGKRATRGKSVMNFLSLAADEKVTSILPVPLATKKEAKSLMMVTTSGVVKKTSADSFRDVRRSGIIAIKLDKNDTLHSAHFVDRGDELLLGSSRGQAIRFKESEVREMGRAAGGVRGIKLKKGDLIVSADVVKRGENTRYLVMTVNGYGKATELKEYKVQKRGGSGIKTVKVTAKTGPLMSGKILPPGECEIIAMSRKSQVIRVDSSQVPNTGRQTQGVRMMKLRDGDSIASLTFLGI